MKQKYYIGDLGFKTKKECKNYTSELINSLGCCIINKDSLHYNFFNNLLKNHPKEEEKKSVGIDYFYIVPNPMRKKCYQTMIKRIDDSIIDFSWVYCCKFKERTVAEELVRSMRSALKDDITKYKRSQTKLICNYCKSVDELYEDFHVDHDDPSFRTIKDNFLKLTTLLPPLEFGNCDKYKITIFKDEDIDFKNEWVDYHNKNCKFQILCKSCNLKKG